MTQYGIKERKSIALTRSFLIFSLFLFCSFYFSEKIKGFAFDGMMLALKVIVPSVFPFMIFSDAVAYYFEFEKSEFLSAIFERRFKISRCAIPAFFSGIIGGFPVGAKNALKLYENGIISKCECERLMSFSNLASPAYVFSAIAFGLLKNLRVGIILYVSLILSSLMCGMIIGKNKAYSSISALKERQKYNFVSSVKDAALASVNVIFFISFFSVIAGLIEEMALPSPITAILLSFIEVGSATVYISESCILPMKLSLSLISFSLSFSGISVIIQSLSLPAGKDMSIKKCALYKLIQGALSFIITLFIPI